MPPVGAAIAVVGAAIGGAVTAVSAFAASSFIASLIVNTAVSVGLSLIARALSPKPGIRQSGIQTAVTTTGGTQPQAFILGRTATAGHHVCPPMSHDDGKTPNGFLTYVIEISDMPGIALSRVILNDGYSALGTTAHADYGYPLLGQRLNGRDHAWIRFYDGSQTAADPMLVARYASYPDRPWSSSFIGTGTAYAVLTFRHSRALFNTLPTVRFELDGIALYDPRHDSSVGGTGAQRWQTPATWARSANPAVMIYNILRGIRLPSHTGMDPDIWGGDVPAEDLPLDNWFAAMNACDAVIGGRPSSTAGLEVSLGMEPAEVIEELAKTCLGQISEMGGVFRMRVGAPAAPVQFITDDDIVISAPQELDPFPGLAASANAVFSDYPEPASLWLAHAAPPVLNPSWEAEDGGRRLATSINFPACSNLSQVAQLMTGYARDARRLRVHRLVLPPEAFLLEPLDSIAWTSARNGYEARIFEVVEIIDQPGTLNQELVLRERDPGDYAWQADQDLPAPPASSGLLLPAAQPVEAWSVAGFPIGDGTGTGRRAALQLVWDGTAAEDAELVRFEVRVQATTQLVASGTADARAGSVVISAGILPDTDYQARGRYVMERPSDWSAWLSATTPDLRLRLSDFGPEVIDLMAAIDTTPPAVPATPVLSSVLVDNGRARLIATWTAGTEADLLGYDVRIRQGGGNAVGFATTTNRYEWDVPAGTSHTVSLRAQDTSGNFSGVSGEVTHVAAADTLPPATPTGLTATGGFGVIWLAWSKVADTDLAGYEIFESTTTTAPGAGTAASFTLSATALARNGLADNVTRYYWIRAFDTSANRSAWSDRVQAVTAVGVEVADYTITPAKLVTGEVITLTAQLRDAIITNAKIVELSAAKLMAGTALTASLTVDGTALSTVNTNAALGAQDPGLRINAASTQIDPGKILISGATTLSDWRTGGDLTRINGGAISANTIEANKLAVGLRGLSMLGILFTPNDPDENRVSWTEGQIAYINDAGTPVTASIAANVLGALWSSGTLYLYWVKGAGTLSATTSIATASGINTVIVATYRGANKVDTRYGKTLIDGDQINTSFLSAITITGDQIQGGAISGDLININNTLQFNEGGALAVGKTSPSDPADGFWFGNPTGSKEFAFTASRDKGGATEQSITIDDTVIELVNPAIKIGTTSASVSNYAATSTLPATRTIAADIDLISIVAVSGGGAGGGSRQSNNSLKGGDGGDTIFEIRGDDSAGLPVVFRHVVPGGQGGAFGRSSVEYTNTRYSPGQDGQSSPYGKGGAGGSYNTNSQGDYQSSTDGFVGTGFGSGGGGGASNVSGSSARGLGGKRGNFDVISEFSFAGHGIVANKSVYVETVGAGGVRLSSGDKWGGNGTGGTVSVSLITKSLTSFNIATAVSTDWKLLSAWVPTQVITKVFSWAPIYDEIMFIADNIGLADTTARYPFMRLRSGSLDYGSTGIATSYFYATTPTGAPTALATTSLHPTGGATLSTAVGARYCSRIIFSNLRNIGPKRFEGLTQWNNTSTLTTINRQPHYSGTLSSLDATMQTEIDGLYLSWNAATVGLRAGVGAMRLYGRRIDDGALPNHAPFGASL